MASRRLAAGIVALMLAQALFSALQGLSLAHERTASIDIFHADPLPDLVITYAVACASLVLAFCLQRGWRWAWTASVVVVGLALIDSLHLVVSPYGGAPYVVLLLSRAVVLYCLALPDVRALY